jgi:hypothetical protein
MLMLAVFVVTLKGHQLTRELSGSAANNRKLGVGLDEVLAIKSTNHLSLFAVNGVCQ